MRVAERNILKETNVFDKISKILTNNHKSKSQYNFAKETCNKTKRTTEIKHSNISKTDKSNRRNNKSKWDNNQRGTTELKEGTNESMRNFKTE